MNTLPSGLPHVFQEDRLAIVSSRRHQIARQNSVPPLPRRESTRKKRAWFAPRRILFRNPCIEIDGIDICIVIGVRIIDLTTVKEDCLAIPTKRATCASLVTVVSGVSVTRTDLRAEIALSPTLHEGKQRFDRQPPTDAPEPPTSHIGGSSPTHGHLLPFPAREKRDPLSIRRKNRLAAFSVPPRNRSML